jgi:hypothetical protein
MVKQNVVYLDNGILFSYRKGMKYSIWITAENMLKETTVS